MTDNAPDVAPVGQTALRPPETVMRLERMGCFFPTRISFMPALVRRMIRERWQFTRPVFDLDADGFGRAVYTVDTGENRYSLVAFSHALPAAERTDRVIAEAWDTTHALFDGEPDTGDLDRLRANVPRQEAGRCSSRELVLSRANKSVRFFDHVVTRLAEGRQPDRDLVRSVGYLMRTTAVYGNGKFGIADRARIVNRPDIQGPFQAEMLTVYLIRMFTIDLAEHIARLRGGGRFTPLAPHLRRHIGIGNATGLGMAPFLVTHPMLINNWMMARETALARTRASADRSPERLARFETVLSRAEAHIREWTVDDERQSRRIGQLRQDMDDIHRQLGRTESWDALFTAGGSSLSMEGQELLVALLLETFPDLVDGLSGCMTAPEDDRLDPAMRLARLSTLLDRSYAWALDVDFSDRRQTERFWYVSAEKQEPRLGNRHEEPGQELEMPLAIARDVQALAELLGERNSGESVAEFLLRHPEHRRTVRRVQTIARHPYGEIRDNLIGAACLPIDMLRCKLSFFGASKFDPKSDRWTRITMFQGAPLPEDLNTPGADDWAFPALGAPS